MSKNAKRKNSAHSNGENPIGNYRNIGFFLLGLSGIINVLALTGSFLLAVTARAADLNAKVDGYRALNESAIVGQLDELARLRSVAADPGGITGTAGPGGFSRRNDGCFRSCFASGRSHDCA